MISPPAGPSVDGRSRSGRPHRGRSSCPGDQVDPGGKGVNVSRALAAAAARPAVLPAGAGRSSWPPCSPPRRPGGGRPGGRSVGPTSAWSSPTAPSCAERARPPARRVEAVTAATVEAAADAEWLACTGSLRQAPIDFYAAWSSGWATPRSRWRSTPAAPRWWQPSMPAPTCQAEPGGAGRGHRPGLLTVGDVVAAAEELRGRGVGAVLASLGADGAVLVDATGPTFGWATVDKARSAVGRRRLHAGQVPGRRGQRPPAPWPRRWPGARPRPPARQHHADPEDLDHSAVTLADRIDPDRPLKERS